MSRKHVSNNKRSRSRARQARRDARDAREMLKLPVQTRRGAQRRAAQNKRRLFNSVCWLGSLAALLAAAWILIDKAFYDNPEFMLKDVQVRTDGTLTKAEILESAQVPAIINLLKIDLAGIDSRVRQRSQVKDVQIERHVPDTLEITVWERTPVAWLGYQGNGLDKRQNGVLLDAEGYAICCHTLFREFYDFPVILVPSNVLSDLVVFREQLKLPGVQAALDLVKRWPAESPDPSLRLMQIDASRDYRLDVDCQPEMRIAFAPENLSGQLLKLADALRHAQSQNRYYAEVNLTVAENIPVIYHEPTFSPEFYAPGAPETLDPAPRWQPSPARNNSLSDEELRAILSVDS